MLKMVYFPTREASDGEKETSFSHLEQVVNNLKNREGSLKGATLSGNGE